MLISDARNKLITARVPIPDSAFQVRPWSIALRTSSRPALLIPICMAATAGKLGGATFAARGVGLDWRTSLQIGTLMNCRGLTELIVLNVGLELGIIDTELFTIMVIMAVISTAMTSPLLGLLEPCRAGRPGADRAAQWPDERAVGPCGAGT